MEIVFVLEERDNAKKEWHIAAIFGDIENAKRAKARLQKQYGDDDENPQWQVTRWRVQP